MYHKNASVVKMSMLVTYKVANFAIIETGKHVNIRCFPVSVIAKLATLTIKKCAVHVSLNKLS